MVLAFRALFFDVGETLVYPHPSAAEIMAEVCAESGFDVTPAQIEAAETAVAPAIVQRQTTAGADLYSISAENSERFWRWVYEQILGALGVPSDARLGVGQRMHRRFMTLETWRLFPDALPTLEAVQRRRQADGLVVGVVSNWEDWLETLLAQLQVHTFFDFLTISAGVRSEKPDPAIFRAALERSGRPATETLHVGDSLHADVRGAQAVGITPVLLDRRGRYTAEQTRGARVIRSLAELPPLLEKSEV